MQPNKEVFDERFEDAAYACTIGQFEEALLGFKELVNEKNSMATPLLANMYLRGQGVPPDVEKGLELLQLAASWGNSTAAYSLGALHQSGDCGVPKDLAKSRQFFLLAKELGCKLPIDD